MKCFFFFFAKMSVEVESHSTLCWWHWRLMLRTRNYIFIFVNCKNALSYHFYENSFNTTENHSKLFLLFQTSFQDRNKIKPTLKQFATIKHQREHFHFRFSTVTVRSLQTRINWRTDSTQSIEQGSQTRGPRATCGPRTSEKWRFLRKF
jgi:hypothetical protein